MLRVAGGPWIQPIVLLWHVGNRAWQNVLDPHSDIIVGGPCSDIIDRNRDPGDIFGGIRNPGDIFGSVCDPHAIFLSDRDPHPSLWLVERLKH